MKLLRPLLNLVMLTVYLVRIIAYVIARIFGSIPGGLALCAVGGMIYGERRDASMLIYGIFAFIVMCRVSSPYLKPRSRPRLLHAPAPPPPPPPTASTTEGWADDPDEATVIGRLNPKLRELLKQKTDSAAS